MKYRRNRSLMWSIAAFALAKVNFRLINVSVPKRKNHCWYMNGRTTAFCWRGIDGVGGRFDVFGLDLFCIYASNFVEIGQYTDKNGHLSFNIDVIAAILFMVRYSRF